MARIPPSNIGPKHLGARVGPKGPGSTKTLTTNTFTTTTGVSSAIHDPSVPRTYLFDIYKNEAESHFEIGEYRLAADCYNAAIKLQPTDTAAIVSRSRCYTQMGRWKRAMKDCDEALGIDPSFPEALYQKAEILYINGNYDLAHVYFKRGLRQQPDSMLFKQAVQKASDAVHRHGPSAVPTKPTKLTAVGDLSMFLHSKQRRNLQREPTRLPADDDEVTKFDLPSAGFRARFNVGPLVRINRKPGVSILRAHRPESARSDTSAASATRMPDESTMRCILGELYGDRKYLKMFQNNLPGGKAERDLTLLADEGLEFLRERTMFWDSLGPLPPPQGLSSTHTHRNPHANTLQMPRRSNMKERSFFFGSKESLNTILSERTPRGIIKNTDMAELSESDGQTTTKADGGKKKLLRRPKKKQKLEVAMGLEKDCTSINFRFNSLQESRSASRIDTGSPDASPLLTALKDRHLTRMGRSNKAGIDPRAQDQKRELTRFINKEMDSIDEAFKTGEFAECKHKAERCLETISDLDGEEINKSEVMASLYSCMGNACIAMNDFDAALNNHIHALHIGETENIKEVINRALGHLGRMYIIQKRFNKALEVFARKAPTVVSAEEVAQVFHEIGNCFLALGHLDYARDCGKKALRAAEDADIHYFKFQSWVLIAVSESRMKHHEEAYKAFQNALELAKKKDDQESMTVILFALEHLSKTITSILKKRELLSDRLSSRSKTQALIDLNKRPHAARQKKRKKRLRREATTLDGVEGGDDFLTRQNTMVDHTFHLTTEDTMYQKPNQTVLPPLPQHHQEQEQQQQQQHPEEPPTPRNQGGRRGSLMFEENPRELEPFADPRLKSRQGTMTTGQLQPSPSPHKRHGILDQIGRREEGEELDTSRERIPSQSQGKVTPRTPRGPSKMDSPAALREGETSRAKMERSQTRGDSRSQSKLDLKMNISSPRNTGEEREKVPGTERQSTHSRTSGHKEENIGRDPSPQKQHVQWLSTNPKHDLSAGALSDLSDTPRDANGNAVEREYVLMTDRTGVTSQSDLDVEGLDTFRGAEVLANRHQDMPQYQAQERRLSRRSADLRDASLDDQDTTLDVTLNTSGGPGFNRSGLTSGQYADLSCAADESIDQYSNIGLQPHDKEFGPSHDQEQREGQVTETANVSPRRRLKQRSRKIHDHADHTPGRFTRESFFEEDEEGHDGAENTTLQNLDDTFDLVSVSRQHIVHPRESRPSQDSVPDRVMDIHEQQQQQQQQQKFEEEGVHRDTNEMKKSRSGETDAVASPRPVALERQSSKVSLKGFSHEAGEVTLETTKPYRVSSAKTNRSANTACQEEKTDGLAADQSGNQGPTEERRPVRSRPEDASTPVKTPKSHVTTGSGWDGDVSMESALGIPELKTATAKGYDAEDLQRPIFSRQKTKIKHRRKPDADNNVDDDDDEANAKTFDAPKPVPRKRMVKRSPTGMSRGGASGADDEDDEDDNVPINKDKADTKSLRSQKSVPSERNNFDGREDNGDNKSLKSKTLVIPEKNNFNPNTDKEDIKSIKSNRSAPFENNLDSNSFKGDAKSLKSNTSVFLEKNNSETGNDSKLKSPANASQSPGIREFTPRQDTPGETKSNQGSMRKVDAVGSNRDIDQDEGEIERWDHHREETKDNEERAVTNMAFDVNSKVNNEEDRQSDIEHDLENISSHPDP